MWLSEPLPLLLTDYPSGKLCTTYFLKKAFNNIWAYFWSRRQASSVCLELIISCLEHNLGTGWEAGHDKGFRPGAGPGLWRWWQDDGIIAGVWITWFLWCLLYWHWKEHLGLCSRHLLEWRGPGCIIKYVHHFQSTFIFKFWCWQKIHELIIHVFVFVPKSELLTFTWKKVLSLRAKSSTVLGIADSMVTFLASSSPPKRTLKVTFLPSCFANLRWRHKQSRQVLFLLFKYAITQAEYMVRTVIA